MRMMLIAALSLALVGAVVLAEEKKENSTTQPVNKMCPVQSENEADPAVTTTYKGKTYAFCCKDCITPFEQDAENYSKKAK